MNKTTAVVIGGIYTALTAALSEEGAAFADEVLLALCESPQVLPSARQAFRSLLDGQSRAITPDDWQIIPGGGAA